MGKSKNKWQIWDKHIYKILCVETLADDHDTQEIWLNSIYYQNGLHIPPKLQILSDSVCKGSTYFLSLTFPTHALYGDCHFSHFLNFPTPVDMLCLVIPISPIKLLTFPTRVNALSTFLPFLLVSTLPPLSLVTAVYRLNHVTFAKMAHWEELFSELICGCFLFN